MIKGNLLLDKFVHKSIYIDYLECAKNAWLKLHKKHDLLNFFVVSDTEQMNFDNGNLAELWARKLFPQGVLIEEHGNDAALLTELLIAQKVPAIFQATFYYDRFLVRNDVLEYNEESGKWRLYEIKGKNSLEESSDEIDHIEDATFQAIVLKDHGIELEDIFIIHLNKNYVRTDNIDVHKLFIKNNITEKVREREVRTIQRMQQARLDLLKEDGPISLACKCIYKGRSAHCKTFGYSHPHIPAVSVHDIARISPKKLTTLIPSNIVKIEDIPDNFDLTDIQKLQVHAYKTKCIFVNTDMIKKEIDKLIYPLHFLDYETYSSSIPFFNGFKPYEKFPTQFSIYVLASANSEPEHFEYLHESNSDPSEFVIKELMNRIRPTGSIIVWNKNFERTINNKLAERHPAYKIFLDDLNNRFFDLEEIFNKQLYVDAGFVGKTSLKNILPVLVPELSYDKLEISDGITASRGWFNMVSKNLTEAEKNEIASSLREYCKLDTYAMYKIWQFLGLIR